MRFKMVFLIFHNRRRVGKFETKRLSLLYFMVFNMDSTFLRVLLFSNLLFLSSFLYFLLKCTEMLIAIIKIISFVLGAF